MGRELHIFSPEVVRPMIVGAQSSSQSIVRVAAVGDLHCTRTSAGSVHVLFSQVAKAADMLLLAASPWADINSIVSTSDNRPMAFDEKSTPARIELPPGQYEITLIDDQGRARKEQVTIQGGEPTRVKVDMGTVNVDELYREVTKP